MNRIDYFRENLERVQQQIADAARRASRRAEDVRLLVVTKGHSADMVEDLLGLGVSDLGESYAEEALEKQLKVAGIESPRWHMIGHVQSRKAKLVPGNFDLLHSLDSLKLARRLDRSAEEADVRLPVMLQVNVSGEDSKHGWRVDDESVTFYDDVEEVLKLDHLQVNGLMTIPPLVESPHAARPYFQRLRQLRDDLSDRYPDVVWRELSMGMSGDFESAILEGATIIRVGTAIVGPRPN